MQQPNRILKQEKGGLRIKVEAGTPKREKDEARKRNNKGFYVLCCMSDPVIKYTKNKQNESDGGDRKGTTQKD